MQFIEYQIIQTVVGEMKIGSFNNQLCLLDYNNRKAREGVDKRLKKGLNAEFKMQDNALLQQTKTQLEEYFNKTRQSFDLPLLTVGSAFQKSVWEALQTIEYGQTTNYGQLANYLYKAKAVRAVANANGANAISIIIPCHRVIGRDGSLTGYAGGLEAKRALLELEA